MIDVWNVDAYPCLGKEWKHLVEMIHTYDRVVVSSEEERKKKWQQGLQPYQWATIPEQRQDSGQSKCGQKGLAAHCVAVTSAALAMFKAKPPMLMNSSNDTAKSCCWDGRFILELIFNNWKCANDIYETTGNLEAQLPRVEMEFLSFSP